MLAVMGDLWSRQRGTQCGASAFPTLLTIMITVKVLSFAALRPENDFSNFFNKLLPPQSFSAAAMRVTQTKTFSLLFLMPFSSISIGTNCGKFIYFSTMGAE